MKKAIKLFGLVFILILITGCGKAASKGDADKYLEEFYPYEQFEYVGKERIWTRKTNECRSVRGNSYTYKSKSTGITFKVFDAMEVVNGLGVCNHRLQDSYTLAVISEVVKNNKDQRIKEVYGERDRATFKVNYKDFDSIDELVNTLVTFRNTYSGMLVVSSKKMNVWIDLYYNKTYVKSILLTNSYGYDDPSMNEIRDDVVKSFNDKGFQE